MALNREAQLFDIATWQLNLKSSLKYTLLFR